MRQGTSGGHGGDLGINELFNESKGEKAVNEGTHVQSGENGIEEENDNEKKGKRSTKEEKGRERQGRNRRTKIT